MTRDEMTDLFVRQLHGELTEEEEQQCAELRTVSKENSELYEELASIHSTARDSIGLEPLNGREITDRIMSGLRATPRLPPRRSWWTPVRALSGGVVTLSAMVVVIALFQPELFFGGAGEGSSRTMQAPSPAQPNSASGGAPSSGFGSARGSASGRITYNDSRVTNSVNAVFLYLEGSLGAVFFLGSALLSLTFVLIWAMTRRSRYLIFAGSFAALSVLVFLLRQFFSSD